jgi:hypothetical protein
MTQWFFGSSTLSSIRLAGHGGTIGFHGRCGPEAQAVWVRVGAQTCLEVIRDTSMRSSIKRTMWLN